MLEQLATLARPVLNIPFIRRTRRNHGLEHATIHLLNQQGYRLSGRSNDSGFVILGDVPTDRVERAVRDALARMRGGEHGLAVHPNCGTNLVTTGLLTSLVAMAGLSGSSRRDSFNRLPLVMMLVMGTILYSQPLGLSLQKHFTTEGDPGDLEVLTINRSEVRLPLGEKPVTVHRVETHSS
ncbi:MAG: hypothetical protein HZC41_07020 [Chloroflexi bacterium]|nr:hypothetical protein [Chloroflexota bacterium]